MKSVQWVFTAGSQAGDTQCVEIIIIDDRCVERDEYFSVNLTTSDEDVKFHIDYAAIRILDDDGECIPWHKHQYLQLQKRFLLHKLFFPTDVIIGLQNSSYTVQEEDESIFICADIVDGCLEQNIQVQYSTCDGTAQGAVYSEVGEKLVNTIFFQMVVIITVSVESLFSAQGLQMGTLNVLTLT